MAMERGVKVVRCASILAEPLGNCMGGVGLVICVVPVLFVVVVVLVLFVALLLAMEELCCGASCSCCSVVEERGDQLCRFAASRTREVLRSRTRSLTC